MMKQVTVRYFAAFRDAAGCVQESIETEAEDLRALFRECAARHHALFEERAALVAVNDELRDWTDPFASGDEVLFFPPVAGG